MLTDTNFDGVRNHLDGRGTKRGDQIDLAIRMAQAEGLSMDAIARNIVIHLHTKKGENFGKSDFERTFLYSRNRSIS